MSKLINLGHVTRETKAALKISRVFDNDPGGIDSVYTCTNNSNPADQFTAVLPGSLKQVVDVGTGSTQYTCEEIS